MSSPLFASLLRRLGAPFSLPPFLADVVTAARESADARRSFLLLSLGGDAYRACADGLLPRELSEDDERLLFLPLARQAAGAGVAISSPDALRDTHRKEILPLASVGIRAVIVVPVGTEGAIVAYRTEPGELNSASLPFLADLARAASELARLRDSRMDDEHTSCLNQRALLRRLDEEVARSAHHGRPLSLILLDLDRFRATGSSETLRRAAKAIRDAVRPTDPVARYVPGPDDDAGGFGGDEFYVLLQETDRREAAALAQRIREALSELGSPASIGLSSLPEDADSSESLLMAAHEALARSRKRGNVVSGIDGPVAQDPLALISAPVLASREGRILEEMLARLYASPLDLTEQLHLTAAFVAAAVDADGTLVIVPDPAGNWIAAGRHRFPQSDDPSVRDPIARAEREKRPVRGSEEPFHLTVPLLHEEKCLAVASVRKKIAPLSHFQERMLDALASRVGAQMARSVLLQKRREEVRLRAEAIRAAVTDLRRNYDFSAIVGEGPKLLAVLQLVARAAETDAPVLVLGESGTGKELMARALHANSRRRKGPFVVLNCAAIPLTLLESELFGHVRGAFTGAIQDRAGLFETADGGTIFLDEIGEMPLETQAKLLRALQFGEIQHLGSDRLVRANTRVVAATNCDLAGLVREKRFREDLYFRINVFQVEVPPLREHPEDVAAIARHYLTRLSTETGRSFEIEAGALEALGKHAFPGNVRELENILLRASALAPGNSISLRELPETLQGGAPQGGLTPPPRTADELARTKRQAIQEVVDKLESSFLRYILAKTVGNVSEASRLSGCNRTSLQKLLAKHNLSPAQFKKRR